MAIVDTNYAAACPSSPLFYVVPSDVPCSIVADCGILSLDDLCAASVQTFDTLLPARPLVP